jgi:hypothetical protein
MGKFTKAIIWTALFLAMMLAIDQFFVQVPPIHPAHAAVTKFYRDFRGRLVDLTFGEKKAQPKSIEAVIDKQQKNKKGKSVGEKKAAEAKPEAKKTQRYLYSDSEGVLHFVDSLKDVPDKYRDLAQPLGD